MHWSDRNSRCQVGKDWPKGPSWGQGLAWWALMASGALAWSKVFGHARTTQTPFPGVCPCQTDIQSFLMTHQEYQGRDTIFHCMIKLLFNDILWNIDAKWGHRIYFQVFHGLFNNGITIMLLDSNIDQLILTISATCIVLPTCNYNTFFQYCKKN